MKKLVLISALMLLALCSGFGMTEGEQQLLNSINIMRTLFIAPNVVSNSFTRPADTTAYTSGDLVANDTNAATVTPLVFDNISRVADQPIKIIRARVAKTSTSTTNANFVLHLFNVRPVSAVGDNGALQTTGVSGYLVAIGTIAVSSTILSDGAKGFSSSTLICKPATGTRNLYGLLAAAGAYTPASAETFTVTLEVEQY